MAVKRYPSVAATVAVLLGTSCPQAILRAIFAVVVLAFQGVLIGWPWPHVFSEEGDAFKPAVANVNTSCSVIPICSVFGIRATPDHRVVDRINLASRKPVTPATAFRIGISQKATATLAITTGQMARTNDNFGTAITQASPVIIFASSACAANYCESAVSFPDAVDKVGSNLPRRPVIVHYAAPTICGDITDYAHLSVLSSMRIIEAS